MRTPDSRARRRRVVPMAVLAVTVAATPTPLPGQQADTASTGAWYVLSYTREPLDRDTHGPPVAYGMHLALGSAPTSMEPLNENYGVLFAAAVPTGRTDINEVRTLRSPYLFHRRDGTFGVVAVRAMADGTPDASAESSVLYFTSPDLRTFTEEGLVDLDTSAGVRDPGAAWDPSVGRYRVWWTDAAGASWRTTFRDLADPASRGPAERGAPDDIPAARVGGPGADGAEAADALLDAAAGIPGAVPASLIAVSPDVARGLEGRFGRIANVAVDVDPLTVRTGEAPDLESLGATLTYSDGSRARRPVDWDEADLAAVDVDAPGTYTVRGTVRQRGYPFPFIAARADPSLGRYRGRYYFIATNDVNGGHVGSTGMAIRAADSIEALPAAPERTILTTGPAGIRGCFWAPELHEFAGTLHVLFAPCIGEASWSKVQAHVLRLRPGGDPLSAADWEAPRPVRQADGSPLQLDAAHPGISLDMTYFEVAGRSYVAWSQRYIVGDSIGDAEIWIATLDPADPYRLTSDPVRLITAEYGWDHNLAAVAEGPHVVQHDGTVYMAYSGSAVGPTYVTGLATAPAGADLLDPASWTKLGYPVLKTDAGNGQWGPGHNTFARDEDGNLLIVYHAKASTRTSERDTGLRRVHWAADGMPILDMTPEEEVAPGLRRVRTTVTVTEREPQSAEGEDGYRLWLRYEAVSDSALRERYRTALGDVVAPGGSPTRAVIRDELRLALTGLLGTEPRILDESAGGSEGGGGTLLVGTPAELPGVDAAGLAGQLAGVGDEGYVVRTTRMAGRDVVIVTGNTDVGVLYGTFALLRHLQSHRPLAGLELVSAPRVRLRLLNHWDNLDRTVERGYAGFSLWDWHKLPDYVSPRYRDYARANASLGINGAVLTNVNADATVLRPEFLDRVAALADVFRPYGIRVYLTARFSAPMELGGLPTADPLDADVAAWWRAKANEIYRRVPDFGGFLVKANSEGQPGPQDFGRSHADGANMLADAVAPHGGVVMWRAFVYSDEEPTDRVRQAYEEFEPLDGEFRDNVLVQVKNGPLDFQPREPFHPLFGAMPDTPLMLELQVTKEYLGMATHLVYLGTLWEEVLEADTYARGPGSTVARVIDGSLHDYPITGIAGVANTGTDRDWTGSHFNQANWYAFGRLAWDPGLDAGAVAEEWIRLTFSSDPAVVEPVKAMMMASREAAVNYMTPLGLAHLMARGHHYGPGPWVEGGPRADWTAVYYHRADSIGIGFDRTGTGSGAVDQYFPPVRDRYARRETVPDSLLLWFHRVRWDERLATGRTLWEELVHRYDEGVETVRWMRRTWAGLEGRIDPRRFRDVAAYLRIQEKEAVWWRDASIAYFQTFSGMPIPDGHPEPAHSLEYYRAIVSRTVR